MTELACAFISVFIITLLIIPFSKRVGLVDIPNKRKTHVGEIPLIGGISMFAGIVIVSLLFVPPSQDMTFLLAACALLVMAGSIDDKYNIHFGIRLVIQALSAILLIYGANTELMSLGDLFGFGVIELGILSTPITIIAVVGIINAFNMIDGMDGLSAGISLASIIGLYFIIGGNVSDGTQSIILLMIGALCAFLIFNLGIITKISPKIFMGDAGSMTLGFIICAFTIRYSQDTKELFKPTTALWIVAIPLMDIFVTSLRRIKHGKNPFKPDRTHIHHIFLRAGISKPLTLILIVTLQCIAIVIALLLEHQKASDLISILLFFLYLTIYVQIVKHAFKVSKLIRKLKLIKQ